MTNWAEGLAARWGGLLLRYRVRVLAATVGVMLVLWWGIPPGPAHPRLMWFSWLALALMVYAVLGFFRFPRLVRRSPQIVILPQLGLAFSPFLWG